MKRFKRGQILRTVQKLRGQDFSKYTDDALADSLQLLRRMKNFMDVQTQETKQTFRVITGGKK